MTVDPNYMGATRPTKQANSPFQRVLTYRLAHVQTQLNAQGTRILRDVAGISLVQWRILTVLGRLGESSSSKLGREANIDKGLLSRKLKSMIEKDFLTSRPHETDNRVQLLTLTDKGQDLHDRTLPHMSARQAVLTKDMSPEELDMLFTVLDKLERAVRDDQAE